LSTDESRVLALQSSSAMLVYYAAACAAYIAFQNHSGKLVLNDTTLMCFLDIILIWFGCFHFQFMVFNIQHSD
jgi:hypothetical protein